MTVEKLPTSGTRQVIQRIEHTLNVINQICIGFVTIYMTYLTMKTGLEGTTDKHAWLVSIGYSCFMAEGVIVHYGGNVLTNTYKRNTKTYIHLVLLTIGGGCGVGGSLLKMIQKGFSLHSVHGKLGFTAFLLCCFALLTGVLAFYATRVKRLMTPLLNKTFHNFLGFATFAIALLAQYYGYQTGYFQHRADSEIAKYMQIVTLISLILSSYGPLKALSAKCQSIWQTYN